MTQYCVNCRGFSATWMLLVFVQGLVLSTHGNYLPSPELMWTMPIVSSTTAGDNRDVVPIFQKGNAIVPLNEYGLLAITSSTGTLHIVSANDVKVVNGTTGPVANATGVKKSYTPTMIGNNLDTITCQGGIIAAIKNSDGSFVVLYAVTGTDSTAQFAPTSRILAIHTASTTLVWNITLPGTIVGTPILSSEMDYLYAVHNVAPSSTSGQDPTATSIGQVSIFQFNAASNIFAGSSNRPPTLITTLPSTPRSRPFGPATIASDPSDGRDYLFFAESSDGSFEETFTDSLYAITKSDDDEFLFLLASSGISSTNTAPTIRNNNNEQLDFFLGQPESKVFGWVGDEAEALFAGLIDGESDSSSTFAVPTWQIESSQNRDDGTMPIPNSPLLSSNGTILYVTAAGTQILALDLESRGLVWSAVDLNSVVLSKPVYDHQQSSKTSTESTSPVIYFMENENSILRQYNALNGSANWVAECGVVVGDGNTDPAECGNAEADFAVLGNVLYYIDVIGNLVAMKVAEFTSKPVSTPAPIAVPIAIPVAKPIAAPTKPSAKPVAPPTTSPTIAKVETPNPTKVSTTTPTIALGANPPTGDEDIDEGISNDQESVQSWFGDNMHIVGISAGAAILFLVLLLGYCACRKNRKNGRRGFRENKRVIKDELRNDERTVATTPVQSNDKSFEIQDLPLAAASPLTSIEEVDDEVDHRSLNDIEKNVHLASNEDGSEKVVENLLERFAVTSFDMEDDMEPRIVEGDMLSREHSSQSTNVMADVYSLASKKEADDAASLTGTLSVASKGSTRSLKDSILFALGMPGKSETGSLKSSSSSKSQQIPREVPAKSDIQRFQPVVSPAPSPRPDYSEPGMIRPGDTNHVRPLLAPGSPTHSLLSNDESLYMDDSTIASLAMPQTEDLLLNLQHDALAGTATVGELPSDCPEDEATNKLQPGLVYLNRHQAKKEQLDQPIRSSLLDDTRRVQPMYNGVSVRPASRSRAGIFSRRQPKIMSTDDNTDDTVGVPELTPEPIVLRTRRTLVTPSSPVVDTQASHHSGSHTPPVRFTAAGYYVEEQEPDESLLNDNSTVDGHSNISSETGSQTEVATNQVAKKDTWNSFLNELSKVENQFFNPLVPNKKEESKKAENRGSRKAHNTPASSLLHGRPSVAAALPTPPPDIMDGSESDEEAILPPPPAPRTFYA